MTMKKIWILCGLLMGILLLVILYLNNHLKIANDGSKDDRQYVLTNQALPVIGSKENLNSYFKQIIDNQSQSGHFFGASEEKSMDMTTSDSASTKQDVSETNIQVPGVDEADLVKTDGTHIFQIGQSKVDIIQAIPAGEMKLIGKITYDGSFSPSQLFHYQNQLVVIGHSESFGPQNTQKRVVGAVTDTMIAPAFQATTAFVYNVENPEKPELIREMKLDGSYVSSRKIEGIVYLVTNHYPNYWILEENENFDIRPMYKDTAGSSKENPVDYNRIEYLPGSNEANFTMIAAFDLERPDVEATITTYLGSGSQLYMSKENLYLAVPTYENQPTLKGDVILTPDSTIYKFSVKDTVVKFQGLTEIQGMVLNQFSMDEHEGYFRIVTTKGNTWDESQPSSNQLYILDRNLKQVGELPELARGERIYSARFLGHRIFMVTFKETDPLFVIDASNPTQPVVLGELKIPGFSNYLHPYDENHIIGFGQDTKLIEDKNSSGAPRVVTDGVKITLFDVSDMAKPKEKFTKVIGGRGTYSLLNHDHKALLFNKNKNLFAFPISVYRNKEGYEYEQIFEFQGAYLYNLDLEKGFTLKLQITHDKEMGQYENWENGIQRLLYIGDTIYALSPGKISAHHLNTTEQIGELSLK